jgi:ubiquinone/menaquinone biosynthesis C-methylase UbiE
MRRPRWIAEQARNARGPLGRLIAAIMARETWAQNRRAIEALDVKPDDRILDLGCGPGRALGMLSDLAPHGCVTGVDSSDLMVEIARRRNRARMQTAHVDVIAASVEALPFPSEAFDKVLCVHVAYFWPDLDAAFRELARVLRPSGRLALLFRTEDDPAAQAFPSEVYRFRSAAAVATAMRHARLAPDIGVASAQGTPCLIVAQRSG